MAWTTPKTWAFQEGLESAEFNVHIRDNLLAGGPHLLVRKTTDETDTSGTMQNDDQLITPTIAANEVWRLEYVLLTTITTGDPQFALSFPSGVVAMRASGITGDRWFGGSTSPTTAGVPVSNNAVTGMIHRVEGIFTCGGTPGVVTLRWCSASGTMVVKANSTLNAVQLA